MREDKTRSAAVANLSKARRDEARAQIGSLVAGIADADAFTPLNLYNEFGHLFTRDLNVFNSCDDQLTSMRSEGFDAEAEYVAAHLGEIHEAGGWAAWVELHPDPIEEDDAEPF